RALAHVARLSTLGEMTSGIAHELNQPLAAIVNYANGCARILSAQGLEDPMVNKGLNAIAEQGKRAADIIARMRKFSRRDDDKREPFLIQDVLSEAIELSMTELHKAGITVETHFAPIREIVVVDGIQIEQVALNLIRNAIEALAQERILVKSDPASPQPVPLSEKGPPSITIRTQRAENTRSEAIGGAPGSVTVSIEDNGPGVPAELVDRLFDPFFPAAGDQIGLGLTISRSIIESHGGRLWYAPGEVGASFRFTLPLRTVPIQE
ncbi:MAG: ATP-binding protein, partial [Planctomycetota bacterium]